MDNILHDWRINLIFFVPHVLEISSILHVALLVFLRLMAVRNPFSEEKRLALYRRISITLVWTTSIVFRTIPLVFSALKMKNSVVNFFTINLYLFRVFPVFAIIIMWGLLIWTAKRKQTHGESYLQTLKYSTEEANSRKMAEIIRRLVIILLVCYIPNLVWSQYVWFVIRERSNPLSREVILLYQDKIFVSL